MEHNVAGRQLARRLEELRRGGYRTHIAFLSLPSADLAVARVAARVAVGGHDVPEGVVRRRFAAGLRNFFGLDDQIVNSWQLFDNSDGPRLVALRSDSGPTRIADEGTWRVLQEHRR